MRFPQSQTPLEFGNGDGTFQSSVTYSTSHPAVTVASADLNLDGVSDLVLTNGYVVTIVHGSHNRTFDAGRDFLASDGPYAPVIADINGDSAPDLIYPNDGVSTVTVLRNLGVTSLNVFHTLSSTMTQPPVFLFISAGLVCLWWPCAGRSIGRSSFLLAFSNGAAAHVSLPAARFVRPARFAGAKPSPCTHTRPHLLMLAFSLAGRSFQFRD